MSENAIRFLRQCPTGYGPDTHLDRRDDKALDELLAGGYVTLYQENAYGQFSIDATERGKRALR